MLTTSVVCNLTNFSYLLTTFKTVLYKCTYAYSALCVYMLIVKVCTFVYFIDKHLRLVLGMIAVDGFLIDV